VGAQRSQAQRDAVTRAVSELIKSLGLDPKTEPELAETPGRIADLYAEVFSGLDPRAEPELTTFEHRGGKDELVIVRGVRFYSLCVHHFVPFFGRAYVAYLPGHRIMGISGAARVVDHYARRPQLQERLTAQIADHLVRALEPRGVAVALNARHLCMEMRGIRRFGRVETRVARGELAEPPWVQSLDLTGGIRGRGPSTHDR